MQKSTDWHISGSPDLKTVMREIDLKQGNYFHKGFLTFNPHKRIPIVTYFSIFFNQNAVTETKQIKPWFPRKAPTYFQTIHWRLLMASIVLGNQSSFDGSTLEDITDIKPLHFTKSVKL